MTRVHDTSSLPGALPAGTFLCPLDAVPEAGGHVVRVACGGAELSLIVLRERGAVRCYLNRCPHLGAELAREDRHLYLEPGVSMQCNLHYAMFRWDDGVCVRGDCLGASLQPVPVQVAEGNVHVGAWPHGGDPDEPGPLR